ncbi:hypothetical protein KV679_10270 [Bacillus sp. JRC01]|nr:hypothetical protein [Bacillus sp. JRC01]
MHKQSLIQKHTVQCSEGHPTSMGIAGRVRPCRLAEAAHRTPHGKRVAAAERNEPFSPSPLNQKRSSWISPYAQASNLSSKSTQCSAAEDGRLPRE